MLQRRGDDARISEVKMADAIMGMGISSNVQLIRHHHLIPIANSTVVLPVSVFSFQLHVPETRFPGFSVGGHKELKSWLGIEEEQLFF